MECPEVVRELVRAYVWHEISTSAMGKLVCNLDASRREALVTKGFQELYPTFVAIFQDWSTNFNMPSATIIAGFSQSTTKELGISESEESANCVICRDPIIGTDIGTLPCRHKFHMPCLEKHLCDAHTCPLCRTILKQGIDRANIVDIQARQAVRNILRASKPAFALVFAEAEMKRIVLRTTRNPSTMNKRNFAMAMVALSDCYLRIGKYTGAYEVAQNALGVCPQLSRLQRAEILRLQANALAAEALAAEGSMHQIGGERVRTIRYTPRAEALFHEAFLLDPVQYQGQIGKDFAHIGIWKPLVDTEATQELSASVQDHLKGGKLRIHCL